MSLISIWKNLVSILLGTYGIIRSVSVEIHQWNLDKTKGQEAGFFRDIEDSLYRGCLPCIPGVKNIIY